MRLVRADLRTPRQKPSPWPIPALEKARLMARVTSRAPHTRDGAGGGCARDIGGRRRGPAPRGHSRRRERPPLPPGPRGGGRSREAGDGPWREKPRRVRLGVGGAFIPPAPRGPALRGPDRTTPRGGVVERGPSKVPQAGRDAGDGSGGGVQGRCEGKTVDVGRRRRARRAGRRRPVRRGGCADEHRR